MSTHEKNATPARDMEKGISLDGRQNKEIDTSITRNEKNDTNFDITADEQFIPTLSTNRYFKNLIPPLSEEELTRLEANLLENGCRDAIKHWRGIIVDGHNRYTICHKHNLPFKTEKLRFGTKKDAAIWIIENQLGRRSLTKAAYIRLALEMARLMKEIQESTKRKCTNGDDMTAGTANHAEPIHVRKYAAKASGTSERVVQQFMTIVEHGSPRLLAQLEQGEVAIGKAYNDLLGKNKGKNSRSKKNRGKNSNSRNSKGNSSAHMPDDYKLDVITKTVEELYVSNSVPDISTPPYADAAEYNIETASRTYRYIMDKSGLIYLGDDLDRVLARLGGQLGVLERML